MTKLLLRLFAGKDPDSPQGRSRVGSLSGWVGILCNLLLFAGKLLAGTLSGSVSITADAMNNLSDASSSVVSLVGFRLARRPADENHPYGHARYEYLAGLAVTSLILVIGFELAGTSFRKILAPQSVVFDPLTVGILVFSVGLKAWMSLFNRSLGKRIRSTTLLATSADSRNDCITTTAVLAAGLIEGATGVQIDGYMGLAVAIFILCSGISLARETISPLLGQGADPELYRSITREICSHPHVLGCHDLMVHDYGPGHRFATVHVEMDTRRDPLYCHSLIDEMERQCLRRHQVHLVIHYDPVDTHDPELLALRQRTQDLLQGWDSRLRLHDFRTIRGLDSLGVLFDVALPADLRGREDQIRTDLETSLAREWEQPLEIRITFDPMVFNQE